LFCNVRVLTFVPFHKYIFIIISNLFGANVNEFQRDNTIMRLVIEQRSSCGMRRWNFRYKFKKNS